MSSSVRRTGLVFATIAALTLSGATTALADGHHHNDRAPDHITVVAAGLDNPRQLAFGPGGDLYVAEAGRGGDGPCFDGPEGGVVCFGTTGAVTRITSHGNQSRVVTGLPSLAAQGDAENPAGGSAAGPSDVAPLSRSKLAVLIGLGADPTLRQSLPSAGRKLGTLVEVKLNHRHRASMRQIADVAGYEGANNPIHDPDSNPVGLSWARGRYLVADAGGNTVLAVKGSKHRSRFDLLGVLPDQMVDAPPELGLPAGTQIPAQGVPTSAVVGPDGAYYVSQLTGFPFPPGKANIYRIGKHGDLSVYATGLTNVTDLAWSGRTLYAVQISTAGMLTSGPIGSLVKVNKRHAPSVIAGNLFAPYGLALKGHSAYVTVGSVAAGGGQVLRIPLR